MIKASIKSSISMMQKWCGNHLKRVKYTALVSGRVSDIAVVFTDQQRTKNQILKCNILIEYKEQQIYQLYTEWNFVQWKGEGTISFSKLKNTAWRTFEVMNYKGKGKCLINLGRRLRHLMVSGQLEDTCGLNSLCRRSRQNNGSPKMSMPDSGNLCLCDLP